MAYSAEISRKNPTCFLFLIDQSGSMQDEWGGQAGTKKAASLATIINNLLQGLVLICSNDPNDYKPRNYFSIGVVGYGSNTVGPAFVGSLAGQELVSIVEIAEKPARIEERTKKVEDGVGGLTNQTVKFPIWFDAVSNGGTPMCEAMARASTILSAWISQHPNSFPPIVINLTDGESTDGDPSAAAQTLRNLATNDGAVLFFNVHLSSHRSQAITFPDSDTNLPDQYAKLLFQVSSQLTDTMRNRARQTFPAIAEGARGFVFNADPVSVIQFLEIGTRPSNLR
jgi:hypothetical protein